MARTTDPATELARAVTDARARASRHEGRSLSFIASVCGTSGDPQGLSRSEAALRDAGVVVLSTNAQATRLACMVALRPRSASRRGLLGCPVALRPRAASRGRRGRCSAGLAARRQRRTAAASTTRSERSAPRLDALTHMGKHPARLLTKARILLKADASEAGEGWSDSRIAEALDTSTDTVARTRQQLVEEGFEAVLVGKHSPASARPRIFDGASEANLIALACSPPPKGRKRWTLQLLEEAVVERKTSSSAPAITQSDGR